MHPVNVCSTVLYVYLSYIHVHVLTLHSVHVHVYAFILYMYCICRPLLSVPGNNLAVRISLQI